MPKKMTPSLDRVTDTLAAMTGLRLRAAHERRLEREGAACGDC